MQVIGVRLIGRHLLGGPTLHALASIRAAKKERRHPERAKQILNLPAMIYVKNGWSPRQ
jgi:hypothetical protein